MWQNGVEIMLLRRYLRELPEILSGDQTITER
jgi:hypothetical protein